MSNDKKKETAQERLARLQREREEAAEESNRESNLVGQLTHEDTGEPDFSELARRLAERQSREAKGENANHVKMTMYIRKDIYDAFNALITRRGQQKEFTNQALSDFIQKKAKELDIE